MKARLTAVLLAMALAESAFARTAGFGVDAFNRAVPASTVSSAVFSPISYEIDCVLFAEAADPIRRATYAEALSVSDEFAPVYSPLARGPLAAGPTNGFHLVWARAFVFAEPRQIVPTYRLLLQEAYGAEVSRARPAVGLEAWVRTRLGGALDGWRLPPLPAADAYSFHDLVSLDCEVAPSNALKRVFPSMTVYRLPLVGGCDFYALVPKEGRPVTSIRPRLTSATLQDILAIGAAVLDPSESLRVTVEPMDIVTTNDLTGAFSYFNFPTRLLKAFPKGAHPADLRQTVRFRLRTPRPAPGAKTLSGPFLFFVHDPVANTIPISGISPAAEAKP